MSIADPFTVAIRPAVAALREAAAARAEATEDEAKVAYAYAIESAVTGFDRLRIAARRYENTPEARDGAAGVRAATPILTDASFRKSLNEAVTALEALKSFVGVGAARAAQTIKAMLDNNDPSRATALYAIAESTIRALKKRKISQ